MPRGFVFVFAEARLAQVDLIFELQPAPFGDRPDGSADGRERRDDAVEKLAVEFGRADVLSSQLRDLAHQTADLLLRLLDQFRVDNLIGAHSRHGFFLRSCRPRRAIEPSPPNTAGTH